MKRRTTITNLLDAAIVLLVLFIGLQAYGIATDGPRPLPLPAAPAVHDTAHSPVQINVLNGCGVSGVGLTMTKFCRQASYDVVEMGNYRSFDVQESMVIDRSGKKEEAQRLAALLGIRPGNVVQQFSNEHIVAASVVIGRDYRSLTPWKQQ